MVIQEREMALKETPYEAILGLERRIGQMVNHKPIHYEVDGNDDFNLVKGVELPLDDGFSISIKKIVKTYDHPIDGGKIVHVPGLSSVRGFSFRTSPKTQVVACEPMIERKIRWVNIGGVELIVTPDDFLLTNGLSIRDGRLERGLALPEQKAVLNWISASIEQRKLSESPIEVKNIFPQVTKSKS